MQTDLSSARCDLLPVSPADAAALHALWTSPGVRRYLWDGEIIPRERTDAAIAMSGELFERHDFGLWLMRERIDRSLAGFAGMWPFRGGETFELLYGVAEGLWGRGYAVEGAQAVIDHAFQVLDLPVIRASTDAANTASVRVLEKLGFARTQRQVVHGLDTVLFEKRR